MDQFANRCSQCIRASVAKCFEFNLAVRQRKNFEEAFFWMPTLRGICEDLIVLNFVKSMPLADREELIRLIMVHDVYKRAHLQERFFREIRIQQAVLCFKDMPAHISSLEGQIHRIWHGATYGKSTT